MTIFLQIAVLLCIFTGCTPQHKAQPTIAREGYDLAYDGKTRNASYVYEKVTADSLKGTTDRASYDFQEDPLIPPPFRATKADYQGSGFDRGHLRPAANARSSPALMQETFFLSNVCPQVPQLNRGYWLQLEKYVRTLAPQYKVLHVFTGPLYLPHTEADGKRYVKYQVIGPHDVAVPTHFFKVICAESLNGSRSIEAYVVPNEPISADTSHEKFRTTLDKVERSAGVLLETRGE